MGKAPSWRCATPGFIWNRLQFAMLRECLHAGRGVASADDIDGRRDARATVDGGARSPPRTSAPGDVRPHLRRLFPICDGVVRPRRPSRTRRQTGRSWTGPPAPPTGSRSSRRCAAADEIAPSRRLRDEYPRDDDALAHVSMLFTEHPELDRPRLARDAGFTRIESWWPPAPDLDAWVEAVQEAGVEVSCLNADGGDIAKGERGFCNLVEREDDALVAGRDALALAARVGADRANVLPGLRVDDRPLEAQLDQAARVYRLLGDLAAESDITIVIEPINARDVPHTSPHRGRHGRPHRPRRTRTCAAFDVYHCAMAGDDPIAAIHRHAAIIGHVQYADCPAARHRDGTSTAVLHALDGGLRRCRRPGVRSEGPDVGCTPHPHCIPHTLTPADRSSPLGIGDGPDGADVNSGRPATRPG